MKKDLLHEDIFHRVPCARCHQSTSHCARDGAFYCANCADIIGTAHVTPERLQLVRSLGVELGVEELERFTVEQIVACAPGWRAVHAWAGACVEQPIACWAYGLSEFFRIQPRASGMPFPPETAWVAMDRSYKVHGLCMQPDAPVSVGLYMVFVMSDNFLGYLGPNETVELLSGMLAEHYERVDIRKELQADARETKGNN